MSIKPKFKIGFELEGTVKLSALAGFDAAIDRIGYVSRGTDGSVSDYWPGGAEAEGIEIRTDPLPLDEGLSLFQRILSRLNRCDELGHFRTDSSAGLHINLSEEMMVNSHDKFVNFFAHLVTHFPEREVLKLFKRASNTYCVPLFTRSGQKKADYLEIMGLLHDNHYNHTHFARGKYHSVAFHSRTPPIGAPESDSYRDYRRVEFRCLGNKNYHKDFEKLQTAIDLIIDSATYAFEQVINPPEEEPKAREIIAEARANGVSIFPTYVHCG